MIYTLLSIMLLAAPPGSPEALYRAGSDAYRAGRYMVAIPAFEAALAGSGRADLNFPLAQAHRLQFFIDGDVAHLEAAVSGYRAYLAEVPDGKRRVHATQHLSTLVPYLERLRSEGEGGAAARAAVARLIVTSTVVEGMARVDDQPAQPVPAAFEVEPGTHQVVVEADEHLPATTEVATLGGAAVAVALDPTPIPGRLTVTAPAGARVLLGGRQLGRSPLPEAVEVSPGLHDLVVLDRGHQPVVRPLEIPRGGAVQVAVELEPTSQRLMAVGALATAGVLGLAGGVTGALALDAEGDAAAIEDRVGQGLVAGDLDRYHELEQRRDGFRDATIGLGVAATSLAALAVAMWLLDDPAPPAVRSAPAAPAPELAGLRP